MIKYSFLFWECHTDEFSLDCSGAFSESIPSFPVMCISACVIIIWYFYAPSSVQFFDSSKWDAIADSRAVAIFYNENYFPNGPRERNFQIIVFCEILSSLFSLSSDWVAVLQRIWLFISVCYFIYFQAYGYWTLQNIMQSNLTLYCESTNYFY